MKKAMIDIETLGTSAEAIITEVAIVICEAGCYDFAIHLHLDWSEQEELGRTIDVWTLRWWLASGRKDMLAESAAVQHDKEGQLRPNMACIFSALFDCDEIWANSPSFDVAIINSLFHQLGMSNIDHTKQRDFRTVRKLHPEVAYEYPVDAHNALADARAQVAHLRKLGVFEASFSKEVSNA
jgi:hypothetical protein